MLTVNEMQARIGQNASLTVNVTPNRTIRVPVRVSNARAAWGRNDFEVTPIGGSGTAWVALGRLSDFQPVPATTPVAPAAPTEGGEAQGDGSTPNA